jgi:hypothetical protein
MLSTTALRDSGILMTGVAALGAVTIGGVAYYNIPTWDQQAVTSSLANLVTMPFFIVGQAGVQVTEGLLGAVGYQSSATLTALRDERMAQSQVPGTPEYSAEQLYSLMQAPGRNAQLPGTYVYYGHCERRLE